MIFCCPLPRYRANASSCAVYARNSLAARLPLESSWGMFSAALTRRSAAIAAVLVAIICDIERLGVATAGELDAETLVERITQEMAANQSVIIGRAEIGAWSLRRIRLKHRPGHYWPHVSESDTLFRGFGDEVREGRQAAAPFHGAAGAAAAHDDR
jgi:hypothetical protein